MLSVLSAVNSLRLLGAAAGSTKNVGPPLRCLPQPARFITNERRERQVPDRQQDPGDACRVNRYGCRYSTMFAERHVRVVHHPPLPPPADREADEVQRDADRSRTRSGRGSGSVLAHSRPVSRGIM